MKTCTKHTEPAKITVPKLVGMTQDEALALLGKLKLKSKVAEEAVSGVAPGTVTEQTPSAGSTATSQTVVTITVATEGDVPDETPVSEFSAPGAGKVGGAVSLRRVDSRQTTGPSRSGSGSLATARPRPPRRRVTPSRRRATTT